MEQLPHYIKFSYHQKHLLHNPEYLRTQFCCLYSFDYSNTFFYSSFLQTAFIIAESEDSDDISVISTVQTVNQVSTIPRPSLKMSILPSKFHKHVPVIGFIDTGADTSMIDPSVLPPDCWEKHLKLLRAVNGETVETTLITKKPIGIQLFPNCIIWKKNCSIQTSR